jgi:predicted NACHT family NTPase
MELIEQIAQAALERDSLQLRSLVQDFAHSNLEIYKLSKPVTNNHNLLVMTAAITELLAERTNQPAPSWTKEVGSLSEPFFLVESALKMRRLRSLCEKESPEPLRKRLLYAPPHFLQYA